MNPFLKWNDAFKEHLTSSGWRVAPGPDPLNTTFTGNIHTLEKTIRDTKRDSKFKFADGSDYLTTSTESRNDFCGGSYDDLEKMLDGTIDMTDFEAAKEKIMSSDVLTKILPAIDMSSKRRKRRLSEHDGDWDYSRRWEIEPFSTAVRAPQAIKRIEVYCHLAVNCSISAGEYNRFGAIAWSIAELLESIGIQTKITGSYRSNQIDTDSKLSSTTEFVIKEFGEYVAPSLVATAFTAVFFRRAGFMMICAGSEVRSTKNAEYLGRSVQYDGTIDYKDGRIDIGPNVTSNCTDEIEKALFGAVGMGSAENGN